LTGGTAKAAAVGAGVTNQLPQQQQQQVESKGIGLSWLAELGAAEEQLCIWILRGWRAVAALPAAVAAVALVTPEGEVAAVMQQVTQLALGGALPSAAGGEGGEGGGRGRTAAAVAAAGGGGEGMVGVEVGGGLAEAAAAAAVRPVKVVLCWEEQSSICGEARQVLKQLALWPTGE
jgi:hypothetical protein